MGQCNYFSGAQNSAMKTTRFAFAFAVLFGACASDPPKTGDYVVTWWTDGASADQADCICFAPAMGYASVQACEVDKSAYPPSSSISACVIDAGHSYPKLERFWRCWADAEAARVACFTSAGCSATAANTCDANRDAALAACVPLRCAQYSTSTACDADVAAFTAAITSCR